MICEYRDTHVATGQRKNTNKKTIPIISGMINDNWLFKLNYILPLTVAGGMRKFK